MYTTEFLMLNDAATDVPCLGIQRFFDFTKGSVEQNEVQKKHAKMLYLNR